MSTWLPFLLSWLQEYGYPALWLGIFVASMGIPLPIGLVLLRAGAFAALGDFDIVLLTLVAVTASACGDSMGFIIRFDNSFYNLSRRSSHKNDTTTCVNTYSKGGQTRYIAFCER